MTKGTERESTPTSVAAPTDETILNSIRARRAEASNDQAPGIKPILLELKKIYPGSEAHITTKRVRPLLQLVRDEEKKDIDAANRRREEMMKQERALAIYEDEIAMIEIEKEISEEPRWRSEDLSGMRRRIERLGVVTIVFPWGDVNMEILWAF